MLILLITANTAVSEIAALNEVMSNAYAAGRCSIYSDLAEFQQRDKLEGGDAFVIAFIREEAKSQSLDFESLLKKCESEVSKHDSLTQAISDQ
jgi:hypothetical protein